MNLVDSCGWLEYFADGPRAGFFAPALEDPGNLMVPTLCLFEVFKRIVQQRGEEAAMQAAALMHQGHSVPLDEVTALYAAQCSITYHLPLADSIILATALLKKAILWTQDSDFKEIAGVKYVPAVARR